MQKEPNAKCPAHRLRGTTKADDALAGMRRNHVEPVVARESAHRGDVLRRRPESPGELDPGQMATGVWRLRRQPCDVTG
jgi:hypothetical protein